MKYKPFFLKIKMASGLQCFGCGVQFGIFKREHSCKNCGHIFCSSCTSQSVVLPNQGSSKHKVCFKCFKQLSSPPDIQHRKKQNDLNKETKEPPGKYFPTNHTRQNIPVSTTTTDIIETPSLDPDEQIRQRLQRLKEKDTPSTTITDDEIGRRFEQLSGRKPITQQQNKINMFVPKKTEQEEISDLLNQVTDECKLDDDGSQERDSPTPNTSSGGNETEVNKDEVQSLIEKTMSEYKHEKHTEKEIEDRLANLKGIDPSVYRNPIPQDIDSDDEEAYNARYLQQNVVDAAPYSKPSSIFSKDYEADDSDDELPWCCICNGNAVLRCHGCDDDLYCKRCFREGHKYEDPEDHTVSSFRPKKKHT